MIKHLKGLLSFKMSWLCRDCNINTNVIGEYYMIQNDLWIQVCGEDYHRMFCIGCVEKKIKRKLTKNDFTKCRINDVEDLSSIGFIDLKKSKRLLNRQGFL